jgi:hypothetical protein
MTRSGKILPIFVVLCAGACNPRAGQVESTGTPQTVTVDGCASKWVPAGRYVPGAKVSLEGVNYEAALASVGQSPQGVSSVGTSALTWHKKGACTALPPSGTDANADPSGSAAADNANVPGATSAPLTPVAVGPNFIFSAYKDLSVNANWNTSVISTKVTGTLTPLLETMGELPAASWSFAAGECGNETWGGMTAAQIATNVPLWVAAKKNYILSTGGAAGSFTCGTDAGFVAFLDRYYSDYMVGVDFDIEAGQTRAVLDALVARVKAAKALPKYSRLRFSFTIATLGGSATQSLGEAGVATLKAIADGGLTDYVINLMVMNYGSPTATNCVLTPAGACDMGLSATQAAANLNAAYAVPFDKIALTPMIGGNNTVNEIFTLDDVGVVLAYAAQKKLAGVHYWSFDRDTDCPETTASPTCNNYGKAGTLGFLAKFLSGLSKT